MDTTRTILNSKRIISIIIAVSTLTALIFLAATQASPSVTSNVLIQDFTFHPHTLDIQPGSTIVWHNKDPVIHTLWFVEPNGRTFELSDPIAPDETWQYTFQDEVELQYYSFKRLWMTGFVSVLDPSTCLEELIETIENMDLPKGIENSLTPMLENAIKQLAKGNENAALGQLTAFIDYVEALKGKKLTNEQADPLTSETQRIMKLIQE